MREQEPEQESMQRPSPEGLHAQKMRVGACGECSGTGWFSPTPVRGDGWPCRACAGTGVGLDPEPVVKTVRGLFWPEVKAFLEQRMGDQATDYKAKINTLQHAAAKVCNSRYSDDDWDALKVKIGDLCEVVPHDLLNKRAGGSK